MSNLPLKALPWSATNTGDKRMFVEHAQGAGIFYTVHGAEQDGYGAVWHDQMEGSHGKKYGFESIEEAKHWIETDHYPSKMQPYVVPSSAYTMLSKSKPNTDGHYLTLKKGFTYEIGNPNGLVPHVGFWNGGRGCFDEDYNNVLFVAWMPIPEFKQGE